MNEITEMNRRKKITQMFSNLKSEMYPCIPPHFLPPNFKCCRARDNLEHEEAEKSQSKEKEKDLTSKASLLPVGCRPKLRVVI